MAIKEMLLPEFDREMATTRKFLERVPEDKPEWRPHAKSMTLARLAGHVSELPMWAALTLTQESIDLNPPGGPTFAPAIMKSRQKLLRLFDGNVKAAREALSGAQDQDFMKPWSLLSGGKTLVAMPSRTRSVSGPAPSWRG